MKIAKSLSNEENSSRSSLKRAYRIHIQYPYITLMCTLHDTIIFLQETEKQQNELRQSQEAVSELKIKVTSLTHKLDNLESKERQLIQVNISLHSPYQQRV